MIKKKKQVDPYLKQLLLELEDVVRRAGYHVRYEKGDFEGGYCIVRESRLFVVNSRNEIDKRILIIARNLKQLGIEDLYIKPVIRDIIENEAIPGKKDREALSAEDANEKLQIETEESENTEESDKED